MVAARGWEWVGDKELLFNGYEVSVWEDEKSPGDGWWLQNNVNIFNIMELYT